jgi:hypothetical protein
MIDPGNLFGILSIKQCKAFPETLREKATQRAFRNLRAPPLPVNGWPTSSEAYDKSSDSKAMRGIEGMRT